MIVGIVSGYFNPIHKGHIEYINEAKKNCEYLVVIVNNDKQVKLKGSIPFMDEEHRATIVRNLKSVDWTIVSTDTDKTVCKSIRAIHNFYPPYHTFKFFNSGDRVNNSDSAEVKVCEELGIEYVTLPLPKVCSSSELIQKASLEV